MDGEEGVREYIKEGGRYADGWIRGCGLRTAKIEQEEVGAVACRGWTARAVPLWDSCFFYTSRLRPSGWVR
jgi:hypothetical protein